MSVRVTCKEENAFAMFDSVTGIAFGEVFATQQDADDFLDHLQKVGERDPRVIPALELAELRAEWDKERDV